MTSEFPAEDVIEYSFCPVCTCEMETGSNEDGDEVLRCSCCGYEEQY